MKKVTNEQLERLLEIKEEIKELTKEAFKIVVGTTEEDRSKGYWYGQIIMALDNEHDFLGENSCTLQECIEGLEEQQDEE